MRVRFRSYLRWCWAALLKSAGLFWWAKRRLRAQRGIVVLTFHRVLPDGAFEHAGSLRGITVRRRTFECMAEFLASRCTVVAAATACNGAGEAGRPLVALTFDDGWADNFTEALPALKRYRLPATVFVCPGLAGRPHPFWPERLIAIWRAGSHSEAVRRAAAAAVAPHLRTRLMSPQTKEVPETVECLVEQFKALDPASRERIMAGMEKLSGSPAAAADPLDALMDWENIAAMEAAGIAIGSHTESHQILTRIPAAEVWREARESRLHIGARLGKECRVFAYPNGDASAAIRAQVARAGYLLAFTTRAGAWSEKTDPLRVPRINIWEGKLVNPRGGFSRLLFEYSVFWKAYTAGR